MAELFKQNEIGSSSKTAQSYTLTLTKSLLDSWAGENIPDGAKINKVTLTCGCIKSKYTLVGSIKVVVNGVTLKNETGVINSGSEYPVDLDITNYIKTGTDDSGNFLGDVSIWLGETISNSTWSINNLSINYWYEETVCEAHFMNGDGSELETVYVNYGQTPACTKTPTKLPTIDCTYTWDETNPWTPPIGSIKSNVTYTPNFIETIIARTYPVIINEERVSGIYVVPDNKTIVYVIKGSIPELESTTISVNGWSVEVSNVIPNNSYVLEKLFIDKIRIY